MIEFKEATHHLKYDIIGIAEIRRMGTLITEDADHVFCYIGETPGQRGVGFLIKKKFKPNIEKFTGISDRVCLLDLKFDTTTLTLIQVYAPTTNANEEEIEKFYEQVNEAYQLAKKPTILMGDFNAKIGMPTTTEKLITGKFGYGKRNNRGQQLIEFAFQNKLTIMNTIFKKDHKSKWTWISPDKKTTNEIDFILSNSPRQFTNLEVINNLKFPSDHRLVRGTFKIGKIKRSRASYCDAPNILKSPEEISQFIENIKLCNLRLEPDEDVSTYYNKIESHIKCSLKKNKRNEKQRRSIISEETKELIERRYNLQKKKCLTCNEKKELKRLYKTTHKHIKKDYKKYRLDIIKKHISSTGSAKRAYRQLNKSKTWISRLQVAATLTKTQTRNEVVNAASEFYKNLYSSAILTCTNTYEPIEPEPSDDISMFNETQLIKKLEKLKDYKSAGPDNISNEIIKAAKFALATPLTCLFNKILKEQKVPDSWTASNIILLYKKGDPTDVGNYRPISLLPTIYKIFASCLEERLSPAIESHQPIEQAGFRKGFCTVDHIQVVEQVIEKYVEFRRPLYLVFIDYAKAFDSISHDSIWNALEQQDVPNTYLNILKDIYLKSTSRVKLDQTGPAFSIRRGVKQGDPLSPKIFIAVLEQILRGLSWTRKGIHINDKTLSHLRFADDIVLFSESAKQIESMVNELSSASQRIGLELNTSKTKIMTNSDCATIIVNNSPLQYVEDYVYLGKLVSFKKSRHSDDLHKRITASWGKFWSYKEILKSTLPIKLKTKILDSCILPCITYGCQSWIFNKHNRDKIAKCQRAMERSILNIKLKDKVKSSDIRKETETIDVLQHAQLLKWKWAGHLARTTDQRWTKIATEWQGPNGTRARGRPQERWLDEIVMVTGKKWAEKAQDREEWQALEEAFTQRGILNKNNNNNNLD